MKSAETSEKVFERTLSKYVENIGGMAVKLLSQFLRGLPDRMYLLKSGVVIFVEFKSTGKKPTKIQGYIHKRIRDLGFPVLVVDSVETYEKAKSIINTIMYAKEVVYGR
nr:MAG TPA: Nuclease [Caudoviricetes sp.]